MIQQTAPLFVNVQNPKGAGQKHNSELVNTYNISRIVPDKGDNYKVFYTTCNDAGAKRECNATIKEKSLQAVLDVFA